MRLSRVLHGTAITVTGAVALTGLLGLGDARAQEAAPALGGMEGRAASSGLHAYYLPQGALPLETFIDLGAPDALATIASGPTTFARASAADPGDLLASPETLLTNASTDYPAGTVPNYPYRVSATSGFGAPTAESEPAPGLRASVEAGEQGSTARATMPRAAAPAVATVGSMSSLASTTTDGSTVTVHAKTSMSDFDLLGIVVIDSIVTDLTATSAGSQTTLTGGTTVSGASVLGTPVTIDANGVHGSAKGAPGGPDPGGLVGALGGAVNPVAKLLSSTDDLNEALAQVGIRVTLAGPAKQDGDATGQLTAAGLGIAFELSNDTAPALGTIADALPPVEPVVPGAPGAEDIIAFARARHLTRLEMGGATVSLTATPAFTYEAPPFTPVGTAAVDGFAPGADLPSTTPVAAPVATPPALSGPMSTAPASSVPDVPFGAGVGALAALVLLVQPFFGARLARVATGVLAPGGGAASCPLEERS